MRATGRADKRGAIGSTLVAAGSLFLAAAFGSRAALAAGGVKGWVYYGAARTSADDRQGHTTDGGKLRPEDKGPMPDWSAIKPGDRFRTTQGVNLRSDATSDSEAVLDAPLAGRSCVQVIRRNSKAAVDLDLESGGWLFVMPVSCRAAASSNVAADNAAGAGGVPVPTGSPSTTPSVAAPVNASAGNEKPATMWTFLKDNHDTLVLIGGGLAAVATALWAVFTFMVGRRDKQQEARARFDPGSAPDDV